MMSRVSKVAELLCGCPEIVSGISAGGREWIRSHKAQIRTAARSAGVAIEAALQADMRAFADSPTLSVPVMPPDQPVGVDVIVPFYAGDAQFLGESLASINAQRHAIVTAHLIADGCDFPELQQAADHVTVRRYQTPGGWGPYRITNGIVAGGNLQHDFLAIHDVDDVMLADRLWRQIVTLQSISGEMVSSAMEQFVDAGSLHNSLLVSRAKNRPVLYPGTVYTSVPLGHSINSTRTMRRELFERLNGFADDRCSMDFDFCNRARFLGCKVIDDPTILSRRRMHMASITNGQIPDGSELREQINQRVYSGIAAMQRSPTLAIARSLGDLDSGIQLQANGVIV